MEAETKSNTVHKAMYWAGWVVSVLPCLVLFLSASFKFMQPEFVLKDMKEQGYPQQVLMPLGVAEAGSTIVYLIPQTQVLGAILLTGYLGGATDVHVRKGEWAFIFPVLFGVMIWLGLFLRDARIRALIPWRK